MLRIKIKEGRGRNEGVPDLPSRTNRLFSSAPITCYRGCVGGTRHRDAIKLSEKALVGGNLVTHREDDVNTLLLTWKKKERREVRDEFLEIEIENFSISVLG